MRFRVTAVGQLAERGRCVTGEVLAGRITMGLRLRRIQDENHPGWRVSGIEFADSPSTEEHYIGLVFTDAPALDELRQLLPPDSLLVSADKFDG